MRLLIFLLRPTSLEAVVYVFVVIVGLLMASFSSVLDVLIAETEADKFNSLSDVVGSNFQNFLETFDTSGVSATVTTLLFWSAAGAVVYILLWSLFNGFVEFYNETTASTTTVQGQGVDLDGRLGRSIGRLIFRITVVVVAITYMVIVLRLLSPLWVELFRVGITSLDQIGGWLAVSLAIIGGSITVHVFTILARLITMKLRAYGDFSL